MEGGGCNFAVISILPSQECGAHPPTVVWPTTTHAGICRTDQRATPGMSRPWHFFGLTRVKIDSTYRILSFIYQNSRFGVNFDIVKFSRCYSHRITGTGIYGTGHLTRSTSYNRNISPSVISIMFVGQGKLPLRKLHHLFRVRRQVFSMALVWLKTHNPKYYENIIIDVQSMSQLLENNICLEIAAVIRQTEDEGLIDQESSGYVPLSDAFASGT